MSAKESLKKIRDSEKQIQALLEAQQRLRDTVTRVTTFYSETPKGNGGGNDKLLEYASKLDDMENSTREFVDNYLKEREEALKAVEMIRDPTKRLIVTLRYFSVYGWKRISRTTNYSEQHVYRLHNEALKELDPYFPP